MAEGEMSIEATCHSQRILQAGFLVQTKELEMEMQ